MKHYLTISEIFKYLKKGKIIKSDEGDSFFYMENGLLVSNTLGDIRINPTMPLSKKYYIEVPTKKTLFSFSKNKPQSDKKIALGGLYILNNGKKSILLQKRV